MRTKFKEGDIVKVIDEWYINHYNRIGWIFRVRLGKDDKTYIYDILFNDENCTITIAEDSLELVKQDNKETEVKM